MIIARMRPVDFQSLKNFSSKSFIKDFDAHQLSSINIKKQEPSQLAGSIKIFLPTQIFHHVSSLFIIDFEIFFIYCWVIIKELNYL